MAQLGQQRGEQDDKTPFPQPVRRAAPPGSVGRGGRRAGWGLLATAGTWSTILLHNADATLLRQAHAIPPFALASPSPLPSLCPGDLPAAIEPIIQRGALARADWGMVVEPLARGGWPGGDAPPLGLRQGQRTRLYGRNADRFFTPASNQKLLTTAAALVALGPDFRVRTVLYASGVASAANRPADPGRLAEVVAQPAGDPSFSEANLAQLAQQVAARGVRRIDRLSLGGDTSFGSSPMPPAWEWDDLGLDYAPPITEAILNGNTLRLTVTAGPPEPRWQWETPAAADQWQVRSRLQTAPPGTAPTVQLRRDWSQRVLTLEGAIAPESAPVTLVTTPSDPGRYWLARLAAALTAAGVEVGEWEKHNENDSALISPPSEELAAIASPRLAELVTEINLKSDNLGAEVLLRWLGRSREPGGDARSAGLTQLVSQLTTLGVESSALHPVDGSGLSRQNLVTPAALVDLLQAMARSPLFEIWWGSLPVGGESGTLRRRFTETSPLRGRLRAKTGTISQVSALSGYLPHPDYGLLVFSLLVDRSDQPAVELRPVLDQLVSLLDRVRSCSGQPPRQPPRQPPPRQPATNLRANERAIEGSTLGAAAWGATVAIQAGGQDWGNRGPLRPDKPSASGVDWN